jgi:hypothetical protein
MLSDEQIVEMAPRILAMVQTPGWQDFIRVVSDKISTTMDQAIADEPTQLLYHRGSIDGLKAAVMSADDVLSLARHVTGEKKEARRVSLATGVPLSTFD